VLSIAEKFNLTKFSILGVSGGAPYALACAYSIPENLNSVTIVSGMGPYSYKESLEGQAMMIPKQIRLVQWLMAFGMRAGAMKKPEKLVANINKTIPESDLKFVAKSNKMDCLINLFKESFKKGLRGYLHEAMIYKKNWGFRISDIKTEIYLWHGTADNNVSVELAKRIASEIPNCKSIFLNYEGHFSVLGNHLTDILETFKTK
jgi:pimeloyl-ACP methyl ester carboxylesterase